MKHGDMFQCFKLHLLLASLFPPLLPPAYRHVAHAAPLPRAWTRNSRLPALQARAGRLEAARLHLQIPEPAISFSFPLLASTVTTMSSSEQFTSILPPFPNSPHHHVRDHIAPLLIPSAPPCAVPVARVPLSSPEPTKASP
jgi:hypothetical protein